MKFFVTAFLILFSTQTFSQTTGYFGRRNILEFGLTGQSPLLYNFYALNNSSPSAYKNKNNELVKGVPAFSYGFRINIGRVIDRGLGFYLESGMNYFSVVPGKSNLDVFNFQAQMLDIQSISIMPKIEFASADGLLPIGISNQFGIGVNFYKTLEKNYIGSALINDGSGTNLTTITKENYYDYSQKSIKGYTLMYKLSMRIPIGNRLMYNFGFRYTLNLVPASSDYSNTSDKFLNQSNMREMIKLRENRNLFNFETGISFSF